MSETNKTNVEKFATGDITDDMLQDGENISQEELMKSLEDHPTDDKIVDDDSIDEKTTDEDPENEELNADVFEQSLKDSKDKELKELNERLGTDFKDVNELNKLLKKDENAETNLEHEKDVNDLNFLNDVLKYDDKTLLTEEKIGIARQKGLDVTSEEVLDEINQEIDELFDKGVSKYAADTIRANIYRTTEKLQEKVDKYIKDKELSEKEIRDKRNNEYMTSLQNIYKQKDFYGLKLSKKHIVDAYGKVKNNDIIKKINSNPSLAVELQLILDNKELIAKKAGGKTYSDGINAMAEKLNGKSIKTSSGDINRSHETANDEDELARLWIS